MSDQTAPLKRDRNLSDVVLVGFVLFASVGWIVDAATPLVKSIAFASVISLCLHRIFQHKKARINKLRFFVLSIPIVAASLVGVFHHDRNEDLNILFKLFIAALVVSSISAFDFWRAIPKFLELILPFVVLGYVLQSIGFYFPVPSVLISPEREAYMMTPLLTVFRERDSSRAYGFFWEPAVLAFVANISIIAKLYWHDESISSKKYWREFLILILSQSAGGLISAALIVSLKYVRIRLIQVAGFIFFIGFIAFLAQDFFVTKEIIASMGNVITLNIFDRDLRYDPSFNARSADLYIPFLLATESLFGFFDIEYLAWFSEAFRGQSERIITNSFGAIAYFYGYLIFTMYCLAFSSAAWHASGRKNLLLIPAFVVLYSSNPLSYVLFTLIFILLPAQSKLVYSRASKHG